MSEIIKIAQIMGRLSAGGVESVVFNYYRKIDKNMIQFDFFYDEDSEISPPIDLIEQGANFYPIPSYKKLFPYMKKLEYYFNLNQYKIVHSHVNSLSVIPLYVAKKANIPVRIAHSHSVPGGKEFLKNVIKKTMRITSKIYATDYFACSRMAGEWLFGKKEYEQGNIYIMKNAVDWSKYKIDKATQIKYKREYGLMDKFVIGHIGRLTYAKNHTFMIDILEEILKIKPNAVLFLVGDGERRQNIIRYIEKKNLLGKVIMAGAVHNAWEYYGLIDVMIVPSFFEGLSMTSIESQISGVPVVVSNAVPDDVLISNSCKKLEIDSAKKWANTIISMKKDNFKLNDKSEDYNIDNVVEKLSDWYVNKYNSIK